MRPEPGQVLHFSEDPTITAFRPHVAPTSALRESYVWAVDAARAQDYWFPRQCPRAMAWVGPATVPADAERLLSPGSRRVHAVEYGWLERMRTVRLYAYRFAANEFRPLEGLEPTAHVATESVIPLGPPERVGDLFELHDAAGIELRVLNSLWVFWDAAVASTLSYSGIRLRNARPRNLEQ